jgi:hypothetical protein
VAEELNTRAVAEMAAKTLRQVFPVLLPDGFSGEFSLLDLCGLGAALLLAGKIFLSPDRRAFRVDPALLSTQ